MLNNKLQITSSKFEITNIKFQAPNKENTKFDPPAGGRSSK